MKNSVILVAGGRGTRMKGGVPKQFLLLSGKPILMHTLGRFYHYDPELEILVVLPDEFISFWKELCTRHCFTIAHQIVKGGVTRFHSVKNALEHLRGPGVAAIHDGVRPLVSQETLRRTFAEAEKSGNAVPVIRIPDSVRIITRDGNTAVDRDTIRIVQTPQIFTKDLIREAYSSAPHENFSDDATVVEALGVKINLVEGNPENIKITCPADLRLAEALLGHLPPEE